MVPKIKILALLSAVALAATPVMASGVSGASESDAHSGKSVREQVLSNPQSADIGRTKFASICVYCHGAGGSGGKARPLRGQHFKADYLFTTITNGRTDGANVMPSWNRLPEKLRWQLVAYILSLQAPSSVSAKP
jgi:mono/diheme cytochrome c family protein